MRTEPIILAEEVCTQGGAQSLGKSCWPFPYREDIFFECESISDLQSHPLLLPLAVISKHLGRISEY